MVEAKKKKELDDLTDKLEQEDEEPEQVKTPDKAKILQETQRKED